jgi:hypothetical protein
MATKRLLLFVGTLFFAFSTTTPSLYGKAFTQSSPIEVVVEIQAAADHNETVIQVEPTSPRKLSWKEWLATVGPATKEYITNKAGVRVACAAVGLMLLFYSNPEQSIEAIRNCAPLSILTSIAHHYVRHFLITAAHEGGHALANFLISGKSTDIYMGTNVPADGVEILPHLTLCTLHPSKGTSNPLQNPLPFDEETCIKNIIAVNRAFKKMYPDMPNDELIQLPEYLTARDTAFYKKDFASKLKYIALMIAGPLAGLFANGLLKLATGQPVLNIDVHDIKQLLNFIPSTGSDAGNIVTNICRRPDITAMGEEWETTLILLALFAKAGSEVNLFEHPADALITLRKFVQAGGLAALNYGGLGLAHATGAAPAA